MPLAGRELYLPPTLVPLPPALLGPLVLAPASAGEESVVERHLGVTRLPLHEFVERFVVAQVRVWWYVCGCKPCRRAW